jgi:capsular polysaccharide biosynthesis protein
MDEKSVLSPRQVAKTAFVRAFVFIFGVAFVIGTIGAFLLPKSYVSTSRVRIAINNSSMPNAVAIQNEANLIQSASVLGKVVKKMDLGRVWGKKYGVGEFKVSETIKFLNGMMAVYLVKDSGLIEITMYDSDRDEAALLANTVAEVYSDYRNRPEVYDVAAGNVKVEIVEQAVPAIKPIRPIMPWEILRRAFTEIQVALALAGIVAWIAYLVARNMEMRAEMKLSVKLADDKAVRFAP